MIVELRSLFGPKPGGAGAQGRDGRRHVDILLAMGATSGAITTSQWSRLHLFDRFAGGTPPDFEAPRYHRI